ncbi:MAG TPA: prolipoprotein diacylglyceryl transferase [Chloroflexota bacterium]
MPGFIIVNIDPIIAQLGPLVFRWYGLMYVVGIAVGLWIAIPFAQERGLREDDIWAAVWPSVIAGFVGARLYFVVQQPLGPYLEQPWRIFATWEGGMAFYGAVFAVLITLVLMARRLKISFWNIADAGVIFAVVGQAFGRIGNIINGDIVGSPTDLPWGFVYQHPRSFVADHTIAYQPAAVYELLFNGFLFAVLWLLRRRLGRPGLLTAVYLAGYSLGQFLLFFLRTEPFVLGGLKQAQVTALVVLVAAVALFWWLRVNPERELAPARKPVGPVKGPARLPPKRRKR